MKTLGSSAGGNEAQRGRRDEGLAVGGRNHVDLPANAVAGGVLPDTDRRQGRDLAVAVGRRERVNLTGGDVDGRRRAGDRPGAGSDRDTVRVGHLPRQHRRATSLGEVGGAGLERKNHRQIARPRSRTRRARRAAARAAGRSAAARGTGTGRAGGSHGAASASGTEPVCARAPGAGSSRPGAAVPAVTTTAEDRESYDHPNPSARKGS